MATPIFRPATADEASSVAALVHAAYEHYVEPLGMLPRPMTDNYAEVIATKQVTVAERDGEMAGIIVLTKTDEGFLIDNVAVHPAHRGQGVGKALLTHAEAEAQRAGFDSIYLYTHELMTENLAIYTKLGYVEVERRSQGTFRLSTCVSRSAERVRTGRRPSNNPNSTYCLFARTREAACAGGSDRHNRCAERKGFFERTRGGMSP